jgi:2-polyprenyl-6-methoxyphenol hydroxylase-like FAD-dependent oxidoreductase
MPPAPELPSPNDNFKVVIIGDSIAGLTLAHALSHRGIDFIVLEGHRDIAPCVGVSLCLLPNRERILDQLGLFDRISQISSQVLSQKLWRGDGRLLSEMNATKLLELRYVI